MSFGTQPLQKISIVALLVVKADATELTAWRAATASSSFLTRRLSSPTSSLLTEGDMYVGFAALVSFIIGTSTRKVKKHAGHRRAFAQSTSDEPIDSILTGQRHTDCTSKRQKHLRYL